MTDALLTMDSPVGPLRIGTDGQAVTAVQFGGAAEQRPDTPLLQEAKRQLDAYFASDRESFELPLDPHGTDFQRTVWAELLNIPYGETVSYGNIAARLDLPLTASRAVGLANGSNPIAIVVPCHRVIGADGSLTGYGGGLENKRTLLQLESRRRVDVLF